MNLKKEYLICGGLLLAVIVYYLFLKKEKTDEEKALETTEGNAGNYKKLLSANVAAVTDDSLSDEEMEYNELVNEYKQKYRSAPDKSWTITQLQNRIKEYDQIQKALEQYYYLEDDDKELDDKVLKKMSLVQIQNEIKKVERRKQKESWDIRKKDIESTVVAFQATVKNDGNYFSPRAWDATCLNALLSYNEAEKIYANNYFRDNGGAKTSKNYGGKVHQVTSIYDAIPTGNRRTRRKNKDLAKQVKEAYQNVSGSVNEYGEKLK